MRGSGPTLLGLAALTALMTAAVATPSKAVVISKSNALFDTFDGSSINRSVSVAAADITMGSGLVTDVTIAVDFAKCADSISPDSGGGCDTPGDSFSEELQMTLRAPDGTAVLLVDFGTYNNGGLETASARATVLFDDDASTTVGGEPIQSGTFAPVGALSDFDGLSALGNWTLTLTDDLFGQPGGFFSLTLTLETEMTDLSEPSSLLLLATGFWLYRRRESSRHSGRKPPTGNPGS